MQQALLLVLSIFWIFCNYLDDVECLIRPLRPICHRRSTALRCVNAIVATNRQAGFEYEFEEKYEAGIKLCGTEVKSCRKGQVQLNDGHVQINDGECLLSGVHIAEYSRCGNKFNHVPKRTRKLLLSQKEIMKLEKQILLRNLKIIPIRMYFTELELVKVELGVGKKKSLNDKR
mmetsp:Transcript_17431/g.23977  ORF Transcript_17431/g.23977 Transcript_17431/m.23977 type:complete len:174 (+) Transcript_17431:2-523(+)